MKRVFRGFLILLLFLFCIVSPVWACSFPVFLFNSTEWIFIILFGIFLVLQSAGDNMKTDVFAAAVVVVVIVIIRYADVMFFAWQIYRNYDLIMLVFASFITIRTLLNAFKPVDYKYAVPVIFIPSLTFALLRNPSEQLFLWITLLTLAVELIMLFKDGKFSLILSASLFGTLLAEYMAGSMGYSNLYRIMGGLVVLFMGSFVFRRMKSFIESEKKVQAVTFIFIPLLFFLPFRLPPPFVMMGHESCKHRLREIGTANEMYSCDHQGFYAGSLSELKIVESKESDRELELNCLPDFGRYNDERLYKLYYKRGILSNTPYNYEISDDRMRYTVYCTSGNHRIFGNPIGFPQYSSVMGIVQYRDLKRNE